MLYSSYVTVSDVPIPPEPSVANYFMQRLKQAEFRKHPKPIMYEIDGVRV